MVQRIRHRLGAAAILRLLPGQQRSGAALDTLGFEIAGGMGRRRSVEHFLIERPPPSNQGQTR